MACVRLAFTHILSPHNPRPSHSPNPPMFQFTIPRIPTLTEGAHTTSAHTNYSYEWRASARATDVIFSFFSRLCSSFATVFFRLLLFFCCWRMLFDMELVSWTRICWTYLLIHPFRDIVFKVQATSWECVLHFACVSVSHYNTHTHTLFPYTLNRISFFVVFTFSVSCTTY